MQVELRKREIERTAKESKNRERKPTKERKNRALSHERIGLVTKEKERGYSVTVKGRRHIA